MSIQTRNAGVGDADLLAKLILIADRAHVGRGIWEYILGGSESDCLAFLRLITITRKPHLFHYSNYLIADADGLGPMGGLGGYHANTAGYPALQEALPEVVKKLNFPQSSYEKSRERSSKIIACIPEAVDGAWVIDSVATLPDYRNRGVARNLLDKILVTGRMLGYHKAQVNMYIGNEPALNLYCQLGFDIVAERRDTYFEKNIGPPGMLALTRDLHS